MFSRRIIYIIIFCLYIAAVAYLCFAKPEDVPQLPELWFGLPADKVAHFTMFLPFPILGYIAFEVPQMKIWKRILLIIALIIIGVTAAICTEQMQAVLAYRSSEAKDLAADISGLICGGVTTFIYTFVKHRK